MKSADFSVKSHTFRDGQHVAADGITGDLRGASGGKEEEDSEKLMHFVFKWLRLVGRGSRAGPAENLLMSREMTRQESDC